MLPRTRGEISLLSPQLCCLLPDVIMHLQMMRADVTGGCPTSQGGLPSATWVLAFPGEAWELLGTAQGLSTAALRSCSTARSRVRRQRGCAGGPSLTGRAEARQRGVLGEELRRASLSLS